jgi:hypothetical protein
MTDEHVEHLDEWALAELLDAGSGNAINAKYAVHLASCDECRLALAELTALVGDPAVRAELDRPEWRERATSAPPTRRRATRVAIGAIAAAALLLIGVRIAAFRDRAIDTEPRYRHATIESAAAPILISPSGNVARVDTLRWTSVPRADQYRVTVFDDNGGIAWESVVSDTSVSAPHEVASHWSGDVKWRVQARTGFDRWVDSEFGEFTVRGAAR